jgi:hypothetical protein
VVNFLIRARVGHCCIVGKTMGEGNGVNEGHDMEKEATIG